MTRQVQVSKPTLAAIPVRSTNNYENYAVLRRLLTIRSDQKYEFPRMSLTASFNKQDNLVMGMFCNVPTIDQYNLVPFIQSRDTEVSLQRNANKVSDLYMAFKK